MAQYTTELYNVMMDLSGIHENPLRIQNMASIILNSWEEVFTPFPIWDDAYREILCTKILAHYYHYEIGSETPALFIFRLNRKMQEIMPYYVDLYKTQIQDLDLNDLEVNLYEEYQGNEKGDNRDENKANRSTGTEDKRIRGEEAEETANANTTSTSENDTQSSNNSSGSETKKQTDEMSRDLVTSSNSDKSSESTRNGTDDTQYNSTITDTYDRTDITNLGSGIKHSGTDTETHSGNDINKISDTPQGALTNLEQDRYLTEATIIVHGEKIETKYGHTETKTGKDSLEQTGTVTNAHTGGDMVSHDSEENGTERTNSSETQGGTQTNNINGTNTNENQENTNSSSKDSNTENRTDERKNRLTSTEDYIGNFLEQSGYLKNRDYNKDNWYIKHTHGHQSSNWIDELLKWREALLNIDMMIIKDLEVLFMGLW